MEFNILSHLDPIDIEYIKIIQNIDFFKKIKIDVEKSYKYFNESKNYFFTFDIGDFKKKYSSKEIIYLITKRTNIRDVIDLLFTTYFYNIEYFLKIGSSFNNAIESKIKANIYYFTFKPIDTFYIHNENVYNNSKTYSGRDILNIKNISNKINKLSIPYPSFLHYVETKTKTETETETETETKTETEKINDSEVEQINNKNDLDIFLNNIALDNDEIDNDEIDNDENENNDVKIINIFKESNELNNKDIIENLISIDKLNHKDNNNEILINL
jgi:hypothetical protein